ncbi:hypothetical protein ACJEEX_11140, partial [Phocaeicola dorei]|uniref:hypothetical protein n=3 Tax=Phocaeicola dorei TaxID=357276 RepID=UPI003978B037
VFITEDTGGKRQTHYNIRTRVNKNGKRKKTEGKLANLQNLQHFHTHTRARTLIMQQNNMFQNFTLFLYCDL